MRSLVFLALLSAACLQAAAGSPLPVAGLDHTGPVEFEKEILPFLKQSCLACHNQTKAKADLILETPQTILKGGESGPAVVPGKPGESLLMKVASHQEKPFMPPADNKVNANNLKPEELALLKLWIAQGASGEVRGEQSISWRPVPSRVRPILSLALTEDAQFAACGRGNELFIYQLPTHRSIGPLVDPALTRLSAGESRAAHLDLVEALDFSPDGELLASGSYREVKFWRRQHNVPMKLPVLDLVAKVNARAPTRIISVSADALRLATLSTASKLEIWSLAEKKLENEQQLEEAPESIIWLAGGEKIAFAIGTNVHIWTRELKTNQVFTHELPISQICSAGNRLIAGSGSTIFVWNLDSAEKISSFTNQAPITALSLSPDGRKLALASEDNTVRLLNLEDQKLIAELKGEYQPVWRVSQLQRALARATSHSAYRKSMLEKAEKERQAQVERVRKASEAVGAAQKSLAEQQNQVTTAKTEESTIRKELTGLQAKLKEAQENAEKAQAELTNTRAAAKGAEQNALEAKLDELVARAASAALTSNVLAVLKPETEKNEKAVQEKLKAAQKKINDVEAALKRVQITNSASENELNFAIAAAQSASENQTLAQNQLQIAETDSKQLEIQLQSSRSTFTNSLGLTSAVSFSPDGTTVAAATEKGVVTLWSTESGKPLDTIALSYNALGLCLSDDHSLLTWNAENANAWEISPAWKLDRTITSANSQPAFADRVNTVRFSPDGQFLATGGGEPSRSGEIKIWRVKDAQLVQELKGLHSDSVLALAFSPDGRYLASGAADRFAKISELSTGKPIRTLEGHTHHVLALSWKGDGHTLITGGADNLIKVWDVFSGEKKKGPEPLTREVTAVSYIAETDQALASSGDATLRIIKEGGEKVRTFEGPSGYLQAAVAAADGSVILAGGQDGMLRVWRTDDSKVVADYAAR